MGEILEAYTQVGDEQSFWSSLSAAITDDVVLVEAKAAGMDWPEFEIGRERLRATIRHLADHGLDHGWISLEERDVFAGDDVHAALAAVRPHAEQGIPFPIDRP